MDILLQLMCTFCDIALRFRLEVDVLQYFGTFAWMFSVRCEGIFSWNVFLREWMAFPFVRSSLLELE